MNPSYQSSMRNTKQKQNDFDGDLSPNLINSPYLEPPKMIYRPKPPESAYQKARTKNANNRDMYQFPYGYDPYYTSSQFQQPTTARIFRPYQRGNTNQYTTRSLFINATNSRFNQRINRRYRREQINSPYHENHLNTCRLAKLRTDLRMKEQREEERKNRIRINKESADAIRLETEYETETSDLIFAKNDHRIRIIPSYDRINKK